MTRLLPNRIDARWGIVGLLILVGMVGAGLTTLGTSAWRGGGDSRAPAATRENAPLSPGEGVSSSRMSPSGGLLAHSAEDGEESPEDELDKYWGAVEFGTSQLDEVIQYVNREYIDEKVDTSRAYISAANFVLSSLDPPYELVPVTYYEQHREDPVLSFDGLDRDEILLKRREFLRTRFEQMKEAWSTSTFQRKDLDRIVQFAIKEGKTKGGKSIGENRLWLAAAQGFLYALDPHSSLVSVKAWEDSTKETKDSSFDGIGALLTQRFEPSTTLKNRLRGKTRKLAPRDPYLLVQLEEEDKLQRRTFVESPMAGQPAERAGIWAGDEIVKVNGESVVDVPLDKVVARIRGPRGTEVALTLVRQGVIAPVEVKVTRSHIKVTNVDGRMLEEYPCVGYVKLTGFIETSCKDLVTEIQELSRQCDGTLRGLVFDLRNNSGGLLNQGVRISDLFVPEGKIVTVKNRRAEFFGLLGGGDEVYNARREKTLAVPMVTIVNDGSASAAEIVASALQDNTRSLVVGERTFGKASVQTLITPERGQGYYIKLTIARYYGPSGRTLQVVGVSPDVAVPPSVGGKMPLGFREEDLSNHLPKIDSDYVSPNAELTRRLTPCVERRGLAERVFQNNPHPQIRFDYQLFKAADYLECLIEDMETRDERPTTLYLDAAG